jgi:hypothetical protein
MIRKMLAKLSAIKRGAADGRFGAFLARLKLKFFPGKFVEGELSESLLPKRKGSESRHENKFSGIKLSKSKRSAGKAPISETPKRKFLRIKLPKLKGSVGKASASEAPKWRFPKIRFPKLKRSLDRPLRLKLPRHKFPEDVRHMGIFAGWIAVLVLAGSFLWGFTQPVRNRILLTSVNRVLAAGTTIEDLRLEQPVSPWRMPGRASQVGTWYTTTAKAWAVVFPLMTDGIFSPVLGVISAEGTVEALIPLSNHAAAVFSRLPRGALQVYIRRIEAGYAVLRNAREDKIE